MTYPERYLKYMKLSDDQIPVIMHQISPKTKEALIEAMKQKEFPGSGDFKTLGLGNYWTFYGHKKIR